ncbi:MAG TPA: acetyl-CoA carboxylase biotin carboxyl carrier protein [Candidatus Ligilactobacillus excrementigallinarum]|uniref:Biotin carboxyl carrier protein of acetyl-CoA carboxylase n=1 Tax=Candidatus Ligilactobacillus excrementigallinarum TaxID=2838641 RepID=A0A9D2A9V6_9LACO|nr:acetyl-CoA carboxylase biotin carboxyl carrier protein [Candidatus Ligilactobacillus excrementigallinarum]
MNFEEINKIIDKFNNSDLRELEINENQFQIRLSKNETAPVTNSAVTTNSTVTSTEQEEPIQTVKTVENQIKSPMVGTVYLQPEPGKEAFVHEGDKVCQGDVVCIIEAMKMMTEVKSNVDGVISKVLIENEDLVEFDQPLFEVKEG